LIKEKSRPMQMNCSFTQVNIHSSTTVNNNYNKENDRPNDTSIKMQKLEEENRNWEAMYANLQVQKEKLEIENRNWEQIYADVKKENEKFKKENEKFKKENEKFRKKNEILIKENKTESYKANKKIKLHENEIETMKHEKIILQNNVDRQIKKLKKQQNEFSVSEIKIHNLEEIKLEKKHKSDIQSLLKKHQSDSQLQKKVQ